MKRIVIDIPSLLSIEHSCTGCGSSGPCCCGTYEVCVTRAEMDRIVGFLPEAARFCRRLASKDGLDNVFDEAESGLFTLDTTSDGRCILAYRKHGRTLCSLHSAALSLGIPVEAAKPLACILWPLALGEGDPAPLTVHPDALSFKCNSVRNGIGRRLCPSLSDTVAAVFGNEARKRVERAAKMRRRRVTVWTKVGQPHPEDLGHRCRVKAISGRLRCRAIPPVQFCTPCKIAAAGGGRDGDESGRECLT